MIGYERLGTLLTSQEGREAMLVKSGVLQSSVNMSRKSQSHVREVTEPADMSERSQDLADPSGWTSSLLTEIALQWTPGDLSYGLLPS